MMMRPPRRERARRTFVPSARRRSSSTRSSSASTGRGVPAARADRPSSRSRRASSSTWRTERLPCDRQGEELALRERGEAQHRPTVALADPPGADGVLNRRLEIEEPQRVGNRRPCLTDAIGDCFVRHAEQFAELLVGVSRVDRVQICPLEVFHEGELELILLAGLPNDGGDPIEPSHPGGPQAALTGDEAVAVQRLGDQDGLQDAVGGDARRELGERLVLEGGSWLVWVALDLVERDLGRAGRRGDGLWDESRKPASERRRPGRSSAHAGLPIAWRTPRPWSSVARAR